jgi:folylpolyglutamate synthase
MVESVLRESGHTTGLFTSPHLADVRERVRLCGRPLSRERFARHFWAARGALLSAARAAEEAAAAAAAAGGGGGGGGGDASVVGMPGYFRFLTLLGLRIFLHEPCPNLSGADAASAGADAAPLPPPPDAVVLEVGIGGRLDATNVIDRPAAVGIASLGFDHMELLGDTLPLIAAEKAGVIKAGAPVFTVEQPQDAALVLARRAREAPASPAEARVARALGSYSREDGADGPVPLGLRGEHQRANAALAVALAGAWEARWVAAQRRLQQGGGGGGGEAAADGGDDPSTAPTFAVRPASPERLARAEARVALLEQGVLPLEYCRGLAATVWPGRSQVVPDAEFAAAAAAGKGGAASPTSRLTFFLDGAHTPESMASCAQWFAEEVGGGGGGEGAGGGGGAPAAAQRKTLRFLFFNCTRERAPAALLPALVTGLAARGAAPHAALFVPPDSQYGFLAASPSSDARAQAARIDNLSWQRALRDEWDILALATATGAPHSPPLPPWPSGEEAPFDVGAALGALPPLAPDVAGGGGGGGGEADAAASASAAAPPALGRGAVVPGGVAGAVAWLRECARSDPALDIKVLVTGSLYLVGDVLRALDHAPQ